MPIRTVGELNELYRTAEAQRTFTCTPTEDGAGMSPLKSFWIEYYTCKNEILLTLARILRLSIKIPSLDNPLAVDLPTTTELPTPVRDMADKLQKWLEASVVI